jgi:hypothetical protein
MDQLVQGLIDLIPNLCSEEVLDVSVQLLSQGRLIESYILGARSNLKEINGPAQSLAIFVYISLSLSIYIYIYTYQHRYPHGYSSKL